jgi:hypothetical protein
MNIICSPTDMCDSIGTGIAMFLFFASWALLFHGFKFIEINQR